MGINLNKYLEGDYISPQDVKEKPNYIIVKVEEKYSEKYKKEQLILSIDNSKKVILFTLNKTNLKSLIKLWGNDSNKWLGKEIELMTLITEVQGIRKEVIRIKEE